MDTRPIGVFDSGVGGLSILSSVKDLLPHESFVYLADQKNNPYGGRSSEEIQRLSVQAIEFLVRHEVKLVIVACNTVSVNAIEHLRKHFSVPIIAVIPVVKTLAEKSKTGHALVLATPATAKSEYLSSLIKTYANGVKMSTVGTSRLEHFVERGIVRGKKVEEAIHAAFRNMDPQVDSIALGCTHYPFLRDAIQGVVGKNVDIYDSGGAIARRTKAVLEQEGMLGERNKGDVFYTSGEPAEFRRVAEELLKYRIGKVEKAHYV